MADMVSKNRQFNGQPGAEYCRNGHEYLAYGYIRGDGYRGCRKCKYEAGVRAYRGEKATPKVTRFSIG